MIAICRDCRWLSDTAKGQSWVRWYCMQAVNDEVNYVSGEVEAYHLCRFVNKTGQCSMFEQGPNVFNPKETQHASE